MDPRTTRKRLRFAAALVPGALAASALCGCSNRQFADSAQHSPALAEARSASTAGRAADSALAGLARATLDDSGLGEVRGGYDAGSGLVVNFSFQEATYLDHNLIQSIVVPTLTVSPGASMNTASVSTGAGASDFTTLGRSPAASVASPIQPTSTAGVVQSLVNGGATAIAASLGAGGITSLVRNTANNQLVQQMIAANIGISGLSQTMQQSAASNVMSRVQAANSQFR